MSCQEGAIRICRGTVAMNHSKTFLVIAFHMLAGPLCVGAASPNKIIITSKRASCTQVPNKKKQFCFTYLDDVHISMHDGSQADAQKLVIVLDTNSATKQQGVENIKKITLSQQVRFVHEERTARADSAILLPAKKRCFLTGNVHITQPGKGAKEVPLSVDCSAATIDLASGKVTLQGSEQKPVSTTLVINKFTTGLHTKRGGHHATHQPPLASRSS